jgi:hypothetical protein
MSDNALTESTTSIVGERMGLALSLPVLVTTVSDSLKPVTLNVPPVLLLKMAVPFE